MEETFCFGNHKKFLFFLLCNIPGGYGYFGQSQNNLLFFLPQKSLIHSSRAIFLSPLIFSGLSAPNLFIKSHQGLSVRIKSSDCDATAQPCRTCKKIQLLLQFMRSVWSYTQPFWILDISIRRKKINNYILELDHFCFFRCIFFLILLN